MNRASSTWKQLPYALRKPEVQHNNIVLVPASELASFPLWQARARHLPAGSILVVVPKNNPYVQQVGRQLQLSLNQYGRRSMVAITKHGV